MLLDELRGTVVAANFGSYPTAGETAELGLEGARQTGGTEELTPDELAAVERAVVKSVLADQAEAGVDIVTDGQAGWVDPLGPVPGSLEGLEREGPEPWFGTHLRYRRPVITGPLRWHRPVLLDGLEFALAAADRPLKATLPGPLTCALLSRDEHYGRPRAAALGFAEALNREIASWGELELAYVQLDEPAFGPGTDRGLLREVYAELTRGLAIPLVAAPHLADVSGGFEALFRLELAGYHLDLRAHPANAAAFDPRDFPGGTALSLGLLDARSEWLESAAEVAREAEALRARMPDTCPLLLSSSSGLGGLPRASARAKLRLLADVRDLLVGALR